MYSSNSVIILERNGRLPLNNIIIMYYYIIIIIDNYYKNYHIIRLPALFGKGLKKNIIFDLIHNNNINNINLNSKFQWYNLDWLKDDINIVINNNIRICNFFTEPIPSYEIVSLYETVFNKKLLFDIEYFNTDTPQISYNCKTIYDKLFNSNNGYIKHKKTILESLKQYFKFKLINKNNLCVSNICVNNVSQLQFSCLLNLFEITNVQIAPTKIILNWNNINTLNTNINIFKNQNINLYSYQSITYGIEYNIFNETSSELLLNHIKRVIDNAALLNVKKLVFGCPKNRFITDNTNNTDTFVYFFKQLGEYCETKNITICIENVSNKYGCNFLNKIEDCVNIVNLINHPNVKTMVDIGNAIMEKDEWYRLNNTMNINHIDVSNEYLNPLTNNDLIIHKLFNIVIEHIKYNGIINLEFLTTNCDDELSSICNSLTHFINIYGKNYPS